MFGAEPEIPVGQAGDCPADPVNTAEPLELRAGRSLFNFYLARFGERFFCSFIFQSPMAGHGKPFIAAPAHSTPGNALNHRIKEAIDFAKQHDKAALRDLLKWSPAVTVDGHGHISFPSPTECAGSERG